MNPPPIGEALSAGWTAFKANMMPVVIGTLCAMLLSLIPFVGGMLAIPGLLLVGLKAVRGQTPEPADGFVGFQALVDNLVIGLLQIAGLLACCVGAWVSQAVFIPGSFLIVDKNKTWQEAKDVCIAQIWPNWLGWTIFTLVTGLVGGSGAILCGVGIFFTLPIATCAWAYAYEQTLAKA
jgi:uncharacterized membrane protein